MTNAEIIYAELRSKLLAFDPFEAAAIRAADAKKCTDAALLLGCVLCLAMAAFVVAVQVWS